MGRLLFVAAQGSASRNSFRVELRHARARIGLKLCWREYQDLSGRRRDFKG